MKKLLVAVAVVAVVGMMSVGCGKKEEPVTPPPATPIGAPPTPAPATP